MAARRRRRTGGLLSETKNRKTEKIPQHPFLADIGGGSSDSSLRIHFLHPLPYSRYTRDFQEQSSEQIDQTLEQLSINLSTYLDELFRLTVYLYYDDSVVAALEATGGSDIDRLQRRREIESYLDKIKIMPRKDI